MPGMDSSYYDNGGGNSGGGGASVSSAVGGGVTGGTNPDLSVPLTDIHGNRIREVPGTRHIAGIRMPTPKPPPHCSDNACIFVGDLHPLVNRNDLFNVFSSVGNVLWIQIFDCNKQLQRPLNFGFLYFDSVDSAQNAITKMNYTKFYGTPCRLMWKQQQTNLSWTESNIIVKNLPPNTDSQVLHQIFCRFGKILSSKVKTTASGQTLSYGYVQFQSRESANGAIDECGKGHVIVGGKVFYFFIFLIFDF